MNRSVSGFYHDPPVFLQINPLGDAGDVDFSQFDAPVYHAELSCGIRMRASVEGLFAFDFSAVPSATVPADLISGSADFEAQANAVIYRTNIMNTYLAFLYTRQLQVDKFNQERMVVTPELTIAMESLENNTSQGYGNSRVSHLCMSRFPSTYVAGLPYSMDQRVGFRGGPISPEVVRLAAEDLSRLILRHGTEGILLADLFLRATKASQDHNHNLSLINYWAIIERLLNALWHNVQTDHRTRDGDTFINRKRRARLNDNRTFTAAVMSEMLSFLGYIDLEVYENMNLVRKARNEWMHTLKAADSQTTQTANNVCEHLLQDVKDITVLGTVGRRIHG